MMYRLTDMANRNTKASAKIQTIVAVLAFHILKPQTEKSVA
jgi:hypothetical protein